jgi:L-asparaginase II
MLGEAGLDPSALQCPPMLPLNEAAAHALLARVYEDLPLDELAIACASHLALPEQVAAAERLLERFGFTEDDLECGAAGRPPSRLRHNCSGKHAGMLACCVANDWDVASYLDPSHPVQVAIQSWIEELAGEPVKHVAVDGCGAPQHALSLRGLARAYTALVRTQPRVCDAMRAHPFLVGGTGRDVTRLMEGIPGLVAKDGAEGVFAAALPDGSAVALKVEDGGGRARTPILVAALRRLGLDAEILDELATTPVLGGGRPVGEVRVSPALA